MYSWGCGEGQRTGTSHGAWRNSVGGGGKFCCSTVSVVLVEVEVEVEEDEAASTLLVTATVS